MKLNQQLRNTVREFAHDIGDQLGRTLNERREEARLILGFNVEKDVQRALPMCRRVFGRATFHRVGEVAKLDFGTLCNVALVSSFVIGGPFFWLRSFRAGALEICQDVPLDRAKHLNEVLPYHIGGGEHVVLTVEYVR